MIIVKIGGGGGINLQAIAEDLAGIEEAIIIVHGANAVRDDIAARLGVEKRIITSVKGYSSVYSSDELMEVFSMAYPGVMSTKLVELFQSHGINALGLSGIDGQLIRGERNKGIRIRDGDKIKVVRDNSGKPKTANKKLLKLLLDNGFVPLICPPVLDENGRAINTENDDIVRVIHRSLQANAIVQLIEAPGLLDDHKDESSLIPSISKAELAHLEERLGPRIKRKALAIRKLLDEAPTKVIIADGRIDQPVTRALGGNGTVIS